MVKKSILAVVLCSFFVMTTGCISIPTGDGGSIKLSKDGATVTTVDGEKMTVKADLNEEKVSYTVSDSDGNVTESQVSKENSLPESFPAGLPVPKDVELVIVGGSTNGKIRYIVNYQAEGKVADYYKQYRSFIDQFGYEEITDASNGDVAEDSAMENILGKTVDHTLSVGIVQSGTGEFDKGEVRVTLMYNEADD